MKRELLHIRYNIPATTHYVSIYNQPFLKNLLSINMYKGEMFLIVAKATVTHLEMIENLL